MSDAGNGADKTFTTAPNPTPPGVSSQHRRDITATSATSSASLNPHGGADDVLLPVRDEHALRRPHAEPGGQRRQRDDGRHRGGRPHRAAAVHALPLAAGRHQRRRHHARSRPDVHDRAGADRRQPRRVAQDGPVGQRPQPRRPRQRAGLGRADRRARAAAIPVRRRLQGVAHRRARAGRRLPVHDRQPLGATRFRVLTRTQTIITSPVVTARAAVRPAISVRTCRASAPGSRARSCPPCTAPCRSSAGSRPVAGRRSASRPSRLAARTARTTYRFKVFRARKVTRAYRVVAVPERGAYVRGTSRAVFVSRRPARRGLTWASVGV